MPSEPVAAAPPPALPDGAAAALAELAQALPADGLLTDTAGRAAYESDALTMYARRPVAVALPRDEAEVRAVLRACHRHGVPVVARGAGTGLSGGALPHAAGVLLVTARLDRIVTIDPLARTATVQPGVRNIAISEAAARHGLFYGPDPSSQVACSIGGNIAENSGGVRCLKYGLTLHNVERLRWLAADGTLRESGGPAASGYDLTAALLGSEGMLGIVTEATVRLAPLPACRRTMLCAFPSPTAAANAVAATISAGIVPAGMELMDGFTVAVVEEFLHLGYPLDAAMLMVCETDGHPEEAQADLDAIMAICREHEASDFRVAADAAERDLLWQGRKAALPAVGRRATDYYCIDCTIPRRMLGKVLTQIGRLAKVHGLECCNVFHAADGNLHPLIMFRGNDPDQVRRAQEFGAAIMRACVTAGGTITGEHGVGVEKYGDMCVQFAPAALDIFNGLKAAFDPTGILNPGKAVPTPRRCAEFGLMHVKDGKLPFPDLERF